MYLLAPFILKKILKILLADPELWGCANFWPKMAHFSWAIFFGINHYYYFDLPIGPFHCAKFKKILPADPELWGCTIFETKMAHFPKWEFFFFRKPINEPCFFHSCLSTCQKSKSGINLVVKYWPLKNNEISLGESL